MNANGKNHTRANNENNRTKKPLSICAKTTVQNHTNRVEQIAIIVGNAPEGTESILYKKLNSENSTRRSKINERSKK